MSRRDFARRFQETCGLEESDVARIRDGGLVAARLTEEDVRRGFAEFRKSRSSDDVAPTVDRRHGEVGYGIVER